MRTKPKDLALLIAALATIVLLVNVAGQLVIDGRPLMALAPVAVVIAGVMTWVKRRDR